MVTISIFMVTELTNELNFRLCNDRVLAKLKTKVLNLW